MISLDVQGQLFKTNHTNIMKIPYFNNMFNDCGSIPTETLFIDRPPHVFKHVLAWAGDHNYRYPEKYKHELDFYGIDYDKVIFYGSKESRLNEVKNGLKVCPTTFAIVDITTNVYRPPPPYRPPQKNMHRSRSRSKSPKRKHSYKTYKPGYGNR